MRIAIEGCTHGELEKTYETIKEIEEKDGRKVDPSPSKLFTSHNILVSVMSMVGAGGFIVVLRRLPVDT